jgi:hypothetical protein
MAIYGLQNKIQIPQHYIRGVPSFSSCLPHQTHSYHKDCFCDSDLLGIPLMELLIFHSLFPTFSICICSPPYFSSPHYLWFCYLTTVQKY